ncbi:MAG TPA: alpha/beta hydrolase [Acidimicrobiia bacterium]
MVEGSIRLSSGRHLDYFATGPRDAPAVLYCHGTPGSRFELLLARPALERNHVDMRLIALNRPGYGTSSFVSAHGFLPWARDSDEAADRLGLDRFAVLGASGGSPFALACAHTLGDRIRKVAIVAGVAPPDTPGME